MSLAKRVSHITIFLFLCANMRNSRFSYQINTIRSATATLVYHSKKTLRYVGLMWKVAGTRHIVIVTRKNSHEFSFTMTKITVICNRNLYSICTVVNSNRAWIGNQVVLIRIRSHLFSLFNFLRSSGWGVNVVKYNLHPFGGNVFCNDERIIQIGRIVSEIILNTHILTYVRISSLYNINSGRCEKHEHLK